MQIYEKVRQHRNEVIEKRLVKEQEAKKKDKLKQKRKKILDVDGDSTAVSNEVPAKKSALDRFR